jgi:hypothetical protein
MDGNLTTLATRMAALRNAIPGYANAKKIEVARAVHEKLIEATPVDTGAAMSNWPVSLDAPIAETNPPHAMSPRGAMIADEWTHAVDPETTRAANLPMSQEQREAVLTDTKPGDVVFIANNLPYIKRLNAGSSTQAPAGFVEAAVLVGINKFEEASDVTLTY